MIKFIMVGVMKVLGRQSLVTPTMEYILLIVDILGDSFVFHIVLKI